MEMEGKNLNESKSKVILFWGKADYFSQFYKAKFEIDGIVYSCCEQYMMHQKAVLFKDPKMAENILKETKPTKMKRFGRQVKNFDDATWKEKCQDIVEEGNYAKFTQNEDLKNYLLATGDKTIAEASPFDRRWGIGKKAQDKRAQNPKEWKGSNWLGKAIMRVRERIHNEEDKDEKKDEE